MRGLHSSGRICRPEEMAPGQPTEFEAGSELTFVTTEGLKMGVPVKQTIHVGIKYIISESLPSSVIITRSTAT